MHTPGFMHFKHFQGMGENMIMSNSTDITLVEKDNVEPGLIGVGNHLDGNLRVSKVVELTLFEKVGNYMVTCSATDCGDEKLTSRLGILYSSDILRVFPVGFDEMDDGIKAFLKL